MDDCFGLRHKLFLIPQKNLLGFIANSNPVLTQAKNPLIESQICKFCSLLATFLTIVLARRNQNSHISFSEQARESEDGGIFPST